MAQANSGRAKRGFAAMDPAKQREIASRGGRASHGSRKSAKPGAARTGQNAGLGNM